MSGKPTKIIEYSSKDDKVGKELDVTKDIKKHKLHEKMSLKEIKELIITKQQQK